MDISPAELDAVSKVSRTQKKSGQFCHVATYARKVSKKSGNTKDPKRGRIWTVSDISKEADRSDPEHIPHVKNPLRPVPIFGRPVSELEQICEDIVKDATQANGKALRTDTHVLLGAVYSLPIRPADYEENKEKCDQFIKDSMKWHEKMYGPVESAVCHLDESFVHYHVYSVSEDARAMIPGWREKRLAIKKAADAELSKSDGIREGNKAFKTAMIAVQDSYYQEVGIVNELARYGDRRLRYQPGSGESTIKRLEREEFAARERAAREQDKINRKKLSESVLEQERITAESARELVEIKAEKKRIREAAEELERIRRHADLVDQRVDNKVKNLLERPEFIRDEKAKKNEKLLREANDRIDDLEYKLVEKDSFIDKLLRKISELENTIKKLENTIRNLIGKYI